MARVPRAAVRDDAVAAETRHDLPVAIDVVRATPILAAARVLVDLEVGRRAARRVAGIFEPLDAPGFRRPKRQDERQVLQIHRSGIAQIPEAAAMLGGAWIPDGESNL